MNRTEITERCKKIVAKYDIRTQNEFAEKYEAEYGENISQTTVHRMFSNANIRIDSETGFYSYTSKELPSDNSEDDEQLLSFLELHSYGRYTHEKGVPSMWLSVDFNTENLVARHIYDYCNGNISIVCGYGCLWLKCHNTEVYDDLKAILSKHRR